MPKKILILETSATVQKLFTNTLDAQEYELRFEADERNVYTSISDYMPDLFLIHCDTHMIRSFELIQILHSIEQPLFKNLAIGMYATAPSALDVYFAKECGANAFIRLNDKTLLQDIKTLAEIETQPKETIQNDRGTNTVDEKLLLEKAASLLQGSSYKNLMLAKMNDLVEKLETIEDMIQEYLLLVAQVSEVPLAAMYITQNDGGHGYYVCADTIGQKDISDFLTVCSTDYEKNQNKGTISTIKAKRLPSGTILENFYTDSIQLSSYEYGVIKTEKTVLGTVHIVAQGNIISDNHAHFDFCLQHAAHVFDKALMVEKKLFFEKRIRRAFSRFVPDQIIDSLVLQSDETNKKLGVGETRSVAILFSDIRSFTNISEKNRPDVLVAFLNRYFSTMVEIIKKHGGTIDKFIGDAIMAEFGTPISYDDNCRRAIMAAYEMRDALSSVEMGDLVMPEGMTFNIGIGIHYGDVIVGSIGSKDKTDYSVIGDNVNLASRLEGLTKTYGSQILVSDSVRTDAGENAFCFRHLDDVRVKGKKNAVSIYAVDRSENEFPAEYKNAYIKGMELYKQGIWHLAKDYFSKALEAVSGEKAAKLMLERCDEFIHNPPENWDGAIAFMTK